MFARPAIRKGLHPGRATALQSPAPGSNPAPSSVTYLGTSLISSGEFDGPNGAGLIGQSAIELVL